MIYQAMPMTVLLYATKTCKQITYKTVSQQQNMLDF